MAENAKRKTAIEQIEELDEALDESLAQVKLDAARSRGPFELNLLEPIDVDGAMMKQLRLRPLTMREVERISDDDGVVSVLSGMTELTPDQLQSLSSADFSRVNAVMEGFRLRPVAGGQASRTQTK